MLPDRVSNPGPLTYESGALPIALRGPASGNVINTTMGSQILKCQMSKTFTLFTVYLRYTITSDYRCSVRIHKIAGSNPGPFSRRLEMSLCQPSSGWLPFFSGL